MRGTNAFLKIELDVSVNIAQYGHNISAFYREEHDMSNMSILFSLYRDIHTHIVPVAQNEAI